MPLKPKHERLAGSSRHTCGGGKPCGKPGCTGSRDAGQPPRHQAAAGSPAAMPGPVKRAARYSKAVSKWIAAGRPTRSQDEIDQLLAICQGCEHFNVEASACRRCGCNINSQASGLKNKLAMATEQCPLGYWQLSQLPGPWYERVTGGQLPHDHALQLLPLANNPTALAQAEAIWHLWTSLEDVAAFVAAFEPRQRPMEPSGDKTRQRAAGEPTEPPGPSPPPPT